MPFSIQSPQLIVKLLIISAMLLLPGAAWATCMTHADGSTTCCAPGGPCTTTGGQGDGLAVNSRGAISDDVQLHFTFGAGHAWLFGQMAEVFEEAPVGGRMLFGVIWDGWRLDATVFGSDLANSVAPTVSTFSFGGTLYRHFDLWRLVHWHFGIAPHVGGGWTILSESALDSHAGPSLSVGTELYFAGEFFDGFGYRIVADINYEFLWLESEELGRHIDGQLLHVTGGAGVTF